jgi:hypothetical protein
MAREPGPAKKSWRDIDRARSSSFHATETLARHEQKGHQTSVNKEYKAALEALFQKKPDAVEALEKLGPAIRMPKVVASSAPEVEAPSRRQDQLRKILAASSTKAISDSIEAFLNAGHTLPDDQEVFLQMLEHRNEERVRDAIGQLERLLMGQLPKRKPVLVQRLKRIEEHAEEPATRDAANQLRRKVS